VKLPPSHHPIAAQFARQVVPDSPDGLRTYTPSANSRINVGVKVSALDYVGWFAPEFPYDSQKTNRSVARLSDPSNINSNCQNFFFEGLTFCQA
jgi:hypothetical protein